MHNVSIECRNSGCCAETFKIERTKEQAYELGIIAKEVFDIESCIKWPEISIYEVNLAYASTSASNNSGAFNHTGFMNSDRAVCSEDRK